MYFYIPIVLFVVLFIIYTLRVSHLKKRIRRIESIYEKVRNENKMFFDSFMLLNKIAIHFIDVDVKLVYRKPFIEWFERVLTTYSINNSDLNIELNKIVSYIILQENCLEFDKTLELGDNHKNR